jgi:hypothetical protein
MNNKYFLNDGLKSEALKMIETVVFKEIMQVMRARLPDYAHSSSEMHTVAMQAKIREGYELALNSILSLPYESPAVTNNDYERTLLDPTD